MMFRNNKGRFSTVLFFIVVLVLPMAGLLIMNHQLTEANSITSATVTDVASGDTQIFAGAIILLLVIAGLVSLFVKFRAKTLAKIAKQKEADKSVENLSEKIKKL